MALPPLVPPTLVALKTPVHNTISDKELNAWFERTIVGNGKAAPLITSELLEIDTTELAAALRPLH